MHALIIENEWLTSQLIEGCLRDLEFTSFAIAMDEDEAVARRLSVALASSTLMFSCREGAA